MRLCFEKIVFFAVAAVCFSNQAWSENLGNLPADPWEEASPLQEQTEIRTRQTMGVPLPEFTGEKTTYNTAMGQEMIAPEVNITNMLLMTEHLRKLGYEIPPELDDVIRNAPSDLRDKIGESLNDLQNGDQSDPIRKGYNFIAKGLEQGTGLSIENLLMNSLKILDSKR